jgi:hypothetical protein
MIVVAVTWATTPDVAVIPQLLLVSNEAIVQEL